MTPEQREKKKAYEREYAKRPEVRKRMTEYQREWRKTDQAKLSQQEYAKSGKRQKSIQKWNWKKLNIPIDHDIYDSLFTKQSGCCAICGEHQSTLEQKLCPDHDHVTGKLRELLCRRCNTAIGLLKDSYTMCFEAGDYLLKHAEIIKEYDE